MVSETERVRTQQAILTGDPKMVEKHPFGNKGFVSLYTISYRMCSNAGSMDHSEALYDRANKVSARGGRWLRRRRRPSAAAAAAAAWARRA
jgi:hypothetical protein